MTSTSSPVASRLHPPQADLARRVGRREDRRAAGPLGGDATRVLRAAASTGVAVRRFPESVSPASIACPPCASTSIPSKCQGHNRCYALAPELFDVDDYGEAHEIGDGEVPPGWRTRPAWRSPTAPSSPSRSRSDDGPGHHHDTTGRVRRRPRRTTVRSPTGPPTSTTPTRRTTATPTRSGPTCATAARWRTPTATTAPGCRSPTPTCRRSPTTPRTTPRGPSSSATPRSSPPAPIGGAPPISSDPPFHHHARRLLLPPFAPKQIEPWEPEVRKLCNELLDEIEAHARRGRRHRRVARRTRSTSR